jgi:hypothetical protein
MYMIYHGRPIKKKFHVEIVQGLNCQLIEDLSTKYGTLGSKDVAHMLVDYPTHLSAHVYLQSQSL